MGVQPVPHGETNKTFVRVVHVQLHYLPQLTATTLQRTPSPAWRSCCGRSKMGSSRIKNEACPLCTHQKHHRPMNCLRSMLDESCTFLFCLLTVLMSLRTHWAGVTSINTKSHSIILCICSLMASANQRQISCGEPDGCT